MRKSVIIFTFFYILGFSQSFGQCDVLISLTTNVIDGDELGILPGQTICIEGGDRDYLIIRNTHGTAENPIIISNDDFPVVIETGHYYGIKISNCSFIRLSGTGNTQVTYGIQILRVDQGAGISVTDLSTDVEIDHVEIADTDIGGIYAKTDPDCTFTATREKFTMYNFWLHDCFLHDIPDEGLYIGSSKYTGQTITCDGKDTTVLPHVIVGARIYNNLVVNTGWDGIQVSSTISDCDIHDNIIQYDSQEEYEYQMSGILIGGGSSCDCYNNQIYDGKGDGIDVLGLGNMKIYNNLIVNAGQTYKPNDPLAFKHGIYIGETVTTPNATFQVFNNTIVNPKSNGVKFFNDEVISAEFINNLITNPGRLSTEGNQAYINGNQTSINKVTNLFSPDNSSVLFLGQNPYLYDLKPNSPAVNQGTNLNHFGLTFDALNRERPFHTYFDIGAFECYDPQADVREVILDNTMQVFPNPAKDYTKVTTDLSQKEIIGINILDSQGSIVARYSNISLDSTGSFNLDVHQFPKGMYIIELITPNNKYYQTFLTQ